MPQILEFPLIVVEEVWAHTAPMVWADDAAPSDAVPCPWGQEMLGAQATVELASGQTIPCRLLTWDAARRQCRYEVPASPSETVLPLGRVRLVSLTRVRRDGSAFDFDGLDSSMRSEAPAHFELTFTDGTALTGITVGRVERPEGHYLARRVDGNGNTVRLFVPHSAIDHIRFDEVCVGERHQPDRSASRPAARFEPVRTLAQLRAAMAAQSGGPVMRLGEVLLSIGLVTPEQLHAALARREGAAVDMPLGERLVRAGVVSPAAMQRALHMKMGYPVIDVRRYPWDKAASKRLPYARAQELQVLPVGFVDGRIVVVMADPGRIKALEELKFLLDASVIAALPWSDPVDALLPEAYGVGDIGGSGIGWSG